MTDEQTGECVCVCVRWDGDRAAMKSEPFTEWLGKKWLFFSLLMEMRVLSGIYLK